MMKIKFVLTGKISIDGLSVLEVTKGKTVNLNAKDAKHCIKRGWAVEATAKGKKKDDK